MMMMIKDRNKLTAAGLVFVAVAFSANGFSDFIFQSRFSTPYSLSLRHYYRNNPRNIEQTGRRSKKCSLNSRPRGIVLSLKGTDSTLSTAFRTPHPTPPEKQSKYAKEFFSMMDEFAIYDDRDINSIPNERLRALYIGVKAGATEPAVLRAFEVLYEDLAPLRVAGRMIYKNLREIMIKHKERRQEQDEVIMKATGMSMDQIDDGRKAFMKVITTSQSSTTDSNMGELTLKQLVDSGVVETIVELLGYQDFEDLMKVLDHDQDGKIEFEEFMIALNGSCSTNQTNDNPECDIDKVLIELTKRMESFESQQNIAASSKEERKQKTSARYDNMVETFKEWEQYAPPPKEGDGRMMDVLHGCFSGARNKGVVEALKIVYTDYSALRMAGDLIYGLMEKLMKRKIRRKLG